MIISNYSESIKLYGLYQDEPASARSFHESIGNLTVRVPYILNFPRRNTPTHNPKGIVQGLCGAWIGLRPSQLLARPPPQPQSGLWVYLSQPALMHAILLVLGTNKAVNHCE